MGDEKLKEAELRGYGRGYQAGKRKKSKDITQEARMRKENAFWQRAFLAALPAAFSAQNWTRGEKPITSLADRVRLAAETADEAMKHVVSRL